MKDTPVGREETTAVERPWPPEQGEWTYEDWLKLPDDGYRLSAIHESTTVDTASTKLWPDLCPLLRTS